MSQHPDLVSRLRDQGGGLLEIYVLDVPQGAWSAVLIEILQAGYEVSFMLDDGTSHHLDGDAVAFLVATPDRSISLELGATRWWSSMPRADEIDFQGEPQDVRGEEEVRAICEFMAVLSRATGRPALLVPESLDPQGARPYLVVGESSSP